MSKLMIALFVTAGLGFAGASAAQMNWPLDRRPQLVAEWVVHNAHDRVVSGIEMR